MRKTMVIVRLLPGLPLVAPLSHRLFHVALKHIARLGGENANIVHASGAVDIILHAHPSLDTQRKGARRIGGLADGQRARPGRD